MQKGRKGDTIGLIVCMAMAIAGLTHAGIWTPNCMVVIEDGKDYSDKGDPNSVIRIVGTQNGGFSGQVVLFSSEATKGEKATIGDLKQKKGSGAIAASAIEIRYALPGKRSKRSKLPPFDTLAEEPQKEGKIHPIWITVNVPKDAAAGDYEGSLTVGGKNIPIQLTVCGWVMPDPIDYITFVDFIQSAESVALQYKVPLWSDEHFRLMGTCFDQIAKVGNKTVYLHLTGHSNFGNEETIVRWIKNPNADASKGPGAAFTHDFSAVEKYLDTFIRHIGKPKVVVMYDWEPYLGGGYKHKAEPRLPGMLFTVYDPATGKTTTEEGTTHHDPVGVYTNYPRDYIAFWQPVYDGLYEIFKKRGIEGAILAHGLFKDGAQPTKRTVEALKKITPWAVWSDQNHGSPRKIHGELVGYDTTVWKVYLPKEPYPDKGRTYGWRRKNPSRYVAMNDRDIWKPLFVTQLVRGRLLGEMNITGKQAGFGRMGLDFWPVLEAKRGKRTYKKSISARYPETSWSQLNMRVKPYISPGPKGALATVRFEMLREGVQECEARIFLEKALLDSAKRAKLGKEKAKVIQEMLDERVRTILKTFGKSIRSPNRLKADQVGTYINSGWQDTSKTLYIAAAEVAGLVGK